MLQVTVAGTAAFDGTFPLDLAQPFNGRELHLIKQVAGVRMGEINEALAANDFDLIVAFAVIALVRCDRVQKGLAAQCAENLLDAPMGSLTLENVETEAEDGPPPGPPSGGKKT